MPDEHGRTVYLLIGGNQGDRLQNLQQAIRLLEQDAGEILQLSDIYETAAWGWEDQPAFLNQALALHTRLAPEDLLQTTLQIEKKMGRERHRQYAPRNIDIDIIFYGDEVVNLPTLTIPHPQMAKRRFVLQPLADLAPDMMHPVEKITVCEMLAACEDTLPVRRWKP